MACKGSGVQRTFDSGPQSQGTGTPKVAPGPVANTVLRSEAPARAPDEELPRRMLNTGLVGGRLPRSGTVRISSYFRTL
jgi:hypothetical protein